MDLVEVLSAANKNKAVTLTSSPARLTFSMPMVSCDWSEEKLLALQRTRHNCAETPPERAHFLELHKTHGRQPKPSMNPVTSGRSCM